MSKRQEIKKIMSSVWNVSVDEIDDDVAFNKTIYWDSLGHVSLMVALQDNMGIEIDYNTLVELTSLRIIEEYLRMNLKKE